MKGKGRDQRVVRVAGMMSGTSLDGVDVAVVETDGGAQVGFGATGFRPYSKAEQAVLTAALGHWPGSAEAEAAADVVEAAHLEVLQDIEPVDYVGFHGQTLAHDPDAARTHQVGDGTRLAKASGRRIVWDFRSADMQLGGQGAPLAPFYHWALARQLGLESPLAILNLGGVGNLSWVDPTRATPDAEGACLAFDTGPANAPLNDLMFERRGALFDEDGALAQQGSVDGDVLSRFLAQSYFRKIPPKSLDRGAFSELKAWVAPLSVADAAATLVACAAGAVGAGLEHLPARPEQIVVTGGGRHNPVLMDMLGAATGATILPVEDLGWDGDALEAQAFAYLAARVVFGLPTSGPGTTGVMAAVGGGQVSEP